MILIYSEHISRRLQYIMRFMLADIAGAQVAFTSSRDEFDQWQEAKLIYSAHQHNHPLQFVASGLLSDRGIHDNEVRTVNWNGNQAFFPVRSNPVLPFDPFAASFYLITRYEEYLPHKKDIHGRFDAGQALLIREHMSRQPVIDQWAYTVRDIILKHYPGEQFTARIFNYISTVDIDAAYAYREKGLMRTLGSISRSVMQFRFNEVTHRLAVLGGLGRDPFDSYAWQMDMLKKYDLRMIYFILVADYGLNNKNISWMNDRFRHLVKTLSDYAEIGVHPGYGSGCNLHLLRREIERLENMVNREIKYSRHHFLRLTFPESYRLLLQAGITDDFTMGYASHEGFRAGTCTPFNFFDLDQDLETTLRVHPFTYMDGTFLDYQGIDPEQAKLVVQELMDHVKQVNGTFISLWHNESLADTGRWEGWRTLYEFTVEQAYKEG